MVERLTTDQNVASSNIAEVSARTHVVHLFWNRLRFASQAHLKFALSLDFFSTMTFLREETRN